MHPEINNRWSADNRPIIWRR